MYYELHDKCYETMQKFSTFKNGFLFLFPVAAVNKLLYISGLIQQKVILQFYESEVSHGSPRVKNQSVLQMVCIALWEI